MFAIRFEDENGYRVFSADMYEVSYNQMEAQSVPRNYPYIRWWRTGENVPEAFSRVPGVVYVTNEAGKTIDRIACPDYGRPDANP